MKKYLKMKPSGVEWIGEVPEYWVNYSLKRLVAIKITDGPHETPEFIEDGVPFISAESVKDSKIDFNFKRGFISKEQDIIYSKKCKPQKHDIFIVKSGSTTGKIAIVDTNEDFNIWSPLALIRSNPKLVFSKFLFYAFICDYFQRQIQLYWSFGTQPNIGMGVIENLRVILPPLPEQTAIAAYLDRKTAQIDQTIAEKERLIELFREERQAIINHAVTKGIRPGVKMKNSGVEWIGEVSEHWEVKKLKHVADIFGRIGFRGYTVNDIVEEGQGVITLSPGNIKNDILTLESATYLSFEKYYESPEIMIFPNDIVLVKTGSTIGKTAIIPKGAPEMTLNPQLVVLKNVQTVPKFLYYQTTCPFFKNTFEVEQTGGTTPTISQEKINSFPVLVPSAITEQQEIVEYLDQKTAQINAAISGIQQEIALLQEYRQALIFEAVTGKIDVREYAQN